MSTEIRGGCSCGAVSYSSTLEQPRTMACYCKDCQRATGSPMATFVAVPESLMSLEGEAKSHTVKGDSGRAVTRHFCGECGSQLYSTVESMPGVYFVKLGTLENADDLAPQVHIWVKSRPNWCELPAGAPAFEENPPAR